MDINNLHKLCNYYPSAYTYAADNIVAFLNIKSAGRQPVAAVGGKYVCVVFVVERAEWMDLMDFENSSFLPTNWKYWKCGCQLWVFFVAFFLYKMTFIRHESFRMLTTLFVVIYLPFMHGFMECFWYVSAYILNCRHIRQITGLFHERKFVGCSWICFIMMQVFIVIIVVFFFALKVL